MRYQQSNYMITNQKSRLALNVHYTVVQKCMLTKMLCSHINHKLVANRNAYIQMYWLLGFQNDTSIVIHKGIFPAPAACLIKLPSHPTPAS